MYAATTTAAAATTTTTATPSARRVCAHVRKLNYFIAPLSVAV